MPKVYASLGLRVAKSGILIGLDRLGKVFIANGLFIAVTAVYFIFYDIVLGSLPNAQSSSFGALARTLLSVYLPVLLFGVVLNRAYIVARYKSNTRHPIRTLANEVWQIASDRNRLFLGLSFLVIMVPFEFLYVEFKVNIPLLAPFSWDQVFYEMDQTIHFGVDPWRVVHPFFQLSDYLVSALNHSYALWLVTTWVFVTVYAFAGSMTVARTRFLLAFLLTWSIGGSLLAIIFSSAGPAFFSDLGYASDPYAPLMQYLSKLNMTKGLSAIDLQRTLWDGYVSQGDKFGISAMPSIHNAVALLTVIGAWRLNRVAGIVVSIHAFLIYIGSFYLGWHYAVDAYLGWAIALAMWALSGPAARWWHRLPAVEALAASLENKDMDRR